MNEDKFLEKPIIIFGSGRSGTTIISEIIFQHEDLAWHSNYQELFPTSTAINYCRRIFDNKLWRLVKFWTFVGLSKNTRQSRGSMLLNLLIFNPIERYRFWQSLMGKRIDFTRGFLLNEKATDEEKKRIRNFLAKQVKNQGRKRLIMKFTGPARLEFLTSIFPDAIIVSVSREPIATVRSWLEIGFWQRTGIKMLWWTGAYSDAEIAEADNLKAEPALITAFQYKKLMETTAYEIDKLKLNVFKATYEDFVKDPKGLIANVMEHVQLLPSKKVQAYQDAMAVFNRNNRQSKKNPFSDETKQKILDIISSKNN